LYYGNSDVTDVFALIPRRMNTALARYVMWARGSARESESEKQV